jgi:hypothetical protein
MHQNNPNRYVTEYLDLRLCGCMELMAQYPDGHFDWAITDPPYGIGVTAMNMGGRKTVRPDKKAGTTHPLRPNTSPNCGGFHAIK